MANHKKKRQKQKAFNTYIKSQAEYVQDSNREPNKEHYCFSVRISHKEANRQHSKRKPLSIEAQEKAYMRRNEFEKNHIPRFVKPNQIKTYKPFSKT